MFQTDSDEDVIFVDEKCAPKSNEITFDQAKRLALQRDIDQESQPKQLAKPLTSQRPVTGERPVERVKMKMEEKKSDENFVKKKKKLKTGQVSLPEIQSCAVDDGSPAEVQKEKKKCKKVDVVVIDLEEESSDGGGKMKEKKKKKKKKNVTESLNDARGSDVKNENEEEVSRNKKQKQAKNENQVETVPISVKEEEMKKKDRKEKKVKNKSIQIKSENVKIEKGKEEEQQAEKNKLPKKGKKEKNNILAVSTEESKEQVLEKKKKKKTPNDETKMEEDDTSVTKKKSKTKTKVAEKQVRLETPEEEAGEVENLKKKRVKKELKKRLKEKRAQNEVETPQIEGKSKRSKAEKDSMLNIKKDESTESEIVIIEEEETELKRKRKKEKGRKAPVEVSEIEETEPKKKKKKKRDMKGEEEEPLTLKCEEVKEQITESLPTVALDTTSKKRKKISIKVETQAKNVSSETGAKKKKIKEEVKDQHESPQVDVVFLSEKSGNTDEITINQERRQALQMEIDQASQPQKPAKLEGFGQWSTAQFDSSDQQQKFLRLMGGFKKGFQQASGSTGRANMALGKGAQQQLQQGLLGEFERAHSRRVDFNNRGAGLGFTAPSNKKFSIDINTCRSVRFDD